MEKHLEQYKFDLTKAGALLIQSSLKASNNDAIRSKWDDLNSFLSESTDLPDSMNSWRKQLAKLRKNLQTEINEQEEVGGIIAEANRLSEQAYSNIAQVVSGWNN